MQFRGTVLFTWPCLFFEGTHFGSGKAHPHPVWTISRTLHVASPRPKAQTRGDTHSNRPLWKSCFAGNRQRSVLRSSNASQIFNVDPRWDKPLDHIDKRGLCIRDQHHRRSECITDQMLKTSPNQNTSWHKFCYWQKVS